MRRAPRAVGEWLANGPVAFVLRAGAPGDDGEDRLLTREVLEAVERLQREIESTTRRSAAGAQGSR